MSLITTLSQHRHPAIRQYTLIAFFALLLVLLALIDHELDGWALIPVLLGGIATLTLRGLLGPPLVLVVTSGLLLAQAGMRWRPPGWDEGPSTWSEVALAAGLLVYTLAHYRLLSLLRNSFPADPRRQLGRFVTVPRRGPDLVTAGETAALLYLTPQLTALAVAGWLVLRELEPHLGLSQKMWQMVLVVWLTTLVLVIASAVLGYLRRARAGPQESLLYLQDQLWRETHREQSRLYQWMVWMRWRTETRKEQS